MQKRLLLFTSILVAPAAAVIAWMMIPSPARVSEEGSARPKTTTASDTASHFVAEVAAGDASKIVRRSDDDFPELPPAPAFAPPAISPRFTPASQPDADAVARDPMKNHVLPPNERIRVIPRETLAATTPGPGIPAAFSGQPTPGAGAVVLQVDRSLHDPAAWVNAEKPMSNMPANRKEKLADEFAAEIGAAVKNPEAAAKTLDETWKDARARSNWEYQKFFGTEAANRAGINAGRTAVSKP